jgi:Zn-dependent protease
MSDFPDFRIGPAPEEPKAPKSPRFPSPHQSNSWASLKEKESGGEQESGYAPEINSSEGIAKQKKKDGPIRRSIGTIITALAFIIGKLKLFSTVGTMFISIGVYTIFWGWKFAVGFVLLLFCHEMGHAIEFKRQGMKVTAPVFIPFLGAMITMKEMPKNAWKEALAAIAGPVYGTIPAVALWAIGSHYNSHILIALAYTGFILNLFNLLPMSPLDGGRIVAALHPALWFVGLLGMVGLIILWHNPLLVIFLIFGALDVRHRWRQFRHKDGGEYYQLPLRNRLIVALAYFGLAAFLAIAMMHTHINTNGSKKTLGNATTALHAKTVRTADNRFYVSFPHPPLNYRAKLWYSVFVKIHHLNETYPSAKAATAAMDKNLGSTPASDLTYLARIQKGTSS